MIRLQVQKDSIPDPPEKVFSEAEKKQLKDAGVPEKVVKQGATAVDEYIKNHPEIDKSKLPQKNPPPGQKPQTQGHKQGPSIFNNNK